MAPPKIPGSTRKNPAGIAHTGTRTHDTRGVTTIVHGDTITIQIPPGVGERGDYGVARRTAWELKNAKHNKLMRHRWPFAK